VEVEGCIVRRHADQMRRTGDQIANPKSIIAMPSPALVLPDVTALDNTVNLANPDTSVQSNLDVNNSTTIPTVIFPNSENPVVPDATAGRSETSNRYFLRQRDLDPAKHKE